MVNTNASFLLFFIKITLNRKIITEKRPRIIAANLKVTGNKKFKAEATRIKKIKPKVGKISH